MECRVRDAVTGGTHTVFFGEVQRAEASQGDPLAYFRGRFGRLSPELDLTELCEETFAARSAIELGVVELTVGEVGADAVARLRALMETTQGLIADGHFTDVPGWAEANAAFHDAHVALAGSEPLTETYRRLGVAGLILRTYTDATDADPELAGDHRRLVEAYENSDVEAARPAVREHADRAARSQRAAIAAGGGGAMSATQSRADDLREARHPVFSDRKLRLGTFSSNLSYGCAISTIDGTLKADWPSTSSLAAMSDEMDFEALVPVGRWRGFGGPTDFNGEGFECFTWAAATGAQTKRAGLFATSHVPTIHPILAAKQGMTVDHISGGRFALNIVTGWHKPEIEMFGAPLLEHDERYALAAEWLHIIREMWTAEEPFDFDGKYYKVEGAVCRPHPLQKPHPVIMNAGGSEAGRHFAAKECDVAFVIPDAHDADSMRARVDHYRRLAREEYGRELQVWSYAYVVQGDTEQDAKDYLHRYVDELGDWEAADNLVSTMGMNAQTLPADVLQDMKRHFIAGWGGYPVIGTAEQVVEQLGVISDAGFDGCLLSWPRYIDDMRRFQQETYPLLQQAGLR